MAFEPLPIDIALVERLVAEQFPAWADLPVRPVLPGGNDNRTFRLGETLSVRLPSHPAYAAAVEKEQRWLPRLAPRLPLPIPAPVGLGRASADYPCAWSVYGWLAGAPLATAPVADRVRLARDLAALLKALQSVDAREGPAAGRHSFNRGGPLRRFEVQVDEALAALGDRVDQAGARAVWQASLACEWTAPPVWAHGDVAPGNLLVADGRLCGVIDFGTCAVGDPACDLVPAWTMFEGDSRAAFQDALGLDPATWARGRGWALWKALITLAAPDAHNPPGMPPPHQVLAAVIEDHRAVTV